MRHNVSICVIDGGKSFLTYHLSSSLKGKCSLPTTESVYPLSDIPTPGLLKPGQWPRGPGDSDVTSFVGDRGKDEPKGGPLLRINMEDME